MPRRARYQFVQRNPGGRLYLRKPGFPRVRLPGPFGSHEFEVAYYAAMAGKPVEIGAARTIPHSMNALIVAHYGSAEFKALRPSSARIYRRILERFREEHGGKDAAGMKVQHVRQAINERASTPDAANHLLSLLSALMELAIANGWRDDNPTVGVKRLKVHDIGFATWTEADNRNIPAFLSARDPRAPRPRAGARHRAARRGDLVRLGWRHVIKGKLVIRQSKTGASVAVPIVRELQAALDLCPRDRLTFIAQADGRPLVAASLGDNFHEWLGRTGLPDKLSLHGLRKAAARRLAEAGSTAHEIAAVTGHKTLAEVERYCREAEKTKLAESGMGKVVKMFGKEKTK
jgi:integrase